MSRIYESKYLRKGAVEYREYQARIAEACLKANTLVVLPTGLGKTVIAALVAANILERNPGAQIVITAPTRPLVEQHADQFRRMLDVLPSMVKVLTGAKPPKAREAEWREGKIFSVTPQTLQNDLISGRCDPGRWGLLVVDEAHRALGNHPYVFIVKLALRRNPGLRVIGLTASPGSTEEQILRIKRNLSADIVEVRTERDADVRSYVQPVKITPIYCEMNEDMKAARRLIMDLMRVYVDELRGEGVDVPAPSGLTKKYLLELKKSVSGSRRTYAFINNLIRLNHMLELLEAQGMGPLRSFIERMEELSGRGGSAAVKILVGRPEWRRLRDIVYSSRETHPKVNTLKKLVEDMFRENPESRGIVFTSIRDAVDLLVEELGGLEGVRPHRFIGQSSRGGVKGMSQREQLMVLDMFRRGEVNLLVATQVGEEGLDISECNFVVFYDNPPSAIRMVQRMGRTGRRMPGKIYMLITKGTRDEGFYWSGMKKRREMVKVARRLSGSRGGYLPLNRFMGEGKAEEVEIVADNRELASEVAKELILMGVDLRPASLKVGDYILSDRVVVERKTAEDLARSIIDRRLFNQIIVMKNSYERPLLLVEGGIYSPIISPEAVRGAIASVVADYGVPVLVVGNPEEAAKLLYAIAKREQIGGKRRPSIKGGRRPLTLREQQEAVIASLPDIDAVRARRLLSHFGSVRAVLNAGLDELVKVEGIGPKIARKIREVVDSEYR